jgi:O-antigen ligase
MVGFAAGMLFLFWFSPFRQKIVLMIVAAVGIFAAPVVLPPETINRFLTMFGDEQANPRDVEEARQSAEARKYLFFRSIDMTIQNPFLGVGPGQFMVAEAADAKSEGGKGAWHVSHNTYTQFSSEMGLPGLGFFLVTMYSAFFGLSPIRRSHEEARLRRAALMLQMSLVIVAVCAVFLSLGYAGLHYAIIGLSGIFQAAVASEAKRAPAAQPVRRMNHFAGATPKVS